MNGIGKYHWNVYSLVKVSGQSMVNGRWPVANSRLGFINCRMPSRFNAIEGDNHTPCKSRIVQQIFSSFPDFSKTNSNSNTAFLSIVHLTMFHLLDYSSFLRLLLAFTVKPEARNSLFVLKLNHWFIDNRLQQKSKHTHRFIIDNYR